MTEGTEIRDARVSRGRRVISDEVHGLKSTANLMSEGFSLAIDLLLGVRGKVILCGVGKSGLVARKVAATLNSTGTPSLYLSPTDALHGDLGVVQRDDVLLLFSRSGRSEEVSTLLKGVKERGLQVMLITAEPDSNLAKSVSVVLPIADVKEACSLELAPTTSTTSMIALGDALAVVLMEERGFRSTDFAKNHPSGSLGRRLTMKLSDLMVRGAAVPRVSEDATFREIVLEMSRKRLGATLVVESGKLLGIITDGDLRRAFSIHPAMDGVIARDIMSASPMTAPASMQAVDGLLMLEEAKRTHLPLVDEDGIVEGILHLHHLVEAGL